MLRRIIIAMLAVLALVGILVIMGSRGSEGGDAAPTEDPMLQLTIPAPTDPTVTDPPVTDPQAPSAPTDPTDPPPTDPPPTEPPPVFSDKMLTCTEYFVFDIDSQTSLLSSGPGSTRLYPASITKLFTAHVALQYLDPESVITVGKEVELVGYGSSVAGLQVGDRLTVSQLIQGLLLPSGNDAAYVLATAVTRATTMLDLGPSESVSLFVTLMNEEAQQLGLSGTHFTNPDGYHDDDHYTTAADLIVIGQLALKNPIVRECSLISKLDVTFASGKTNSWHNTNLLVDPESEYYCPEAIGLKTGKTNHSGYCVLSAFQWNGRQFLIGVFGCQTHTDRFVDATLLFNAAKYLP